MNEDKRQLKKDKLLSFGVDIDNIEQILNYCLKFKVIELQDKNYFYNSKKLGKSPQAVKNYFLENKKDYDSLILSLEEKLPLIFRFNLKYKDDFDLALKVINLYIKFKELEEADLDAHERHKIDVRDRHKMLLAFYLVNGFSSKSIEDAAYLFKGNIDYVRVMNTELTKSDMIIKDKYNLQHRYLHPVLVNMRNYFMDSGRSTKKMVFLFINDEQKQ